MGRTAKDRRDLPHPPPVERIELPGGSTGLRLAAAALFLLVGAAALAYSISRLFAPETGWQEIEAGASQGVTCAGEFSLFYELGAGDRDPREERQALTAVYTRACRAAYQMFNTVERFEDVVSLLELSQRPNEALEVDGALYRAFETVQAAGDRTVYLGPVYARYGNLFSCQDDGMLADFDPRLSGEVAAEYAAYAAYAADPGHIDVELLGENRLRLRVSEEYLSYVRGEGIDCLLDFGWLRNAFAADYLADTLSEGGFTSGSIASWDGFARCLDAREGQAYTLDLLDELEPGRPVFAARAQYQGPMSLVTLRNFPALEEDAGRFYRLRDGQVRTMYLDPADGLCRSAADSLTGCSAVLNCAGVALRLGPVFIADALDAAALDRLEAEGVHTVCCRDRTLRVSTPALTLTGLYEGYSLEQPKK